MLVRFDSVRFNSIQSRWLIQCGSASTESPTRIKLNWIDWIGSSWIAHPAAAVRLNQIESDESLESNSIEFISNESWIGLNATCSFCRVEIISPALKHNDTHTLLKAQVKRSNQTHVSMAPEQRCTFQTRRLSSPQIAAIILLSIRMPGTHAKASGMPCFRSHVVFIELNYLNEATTSSQLEMREYLIHYFVFFVICSCGRVAVSLYATPRGRSCVLCVYDLKGNGQCEQPGATAAKRW